GIDIRGDNNKVGGSIIRKNGLFGLQVGGVESQNNVIGGPSFGNPLTGNVISANDIGVRLEGGPYTILAGNKIGTTADGLSDDGNDNHGIEVFSSNNFIGGPAATANIISGNGGDGVHIVESSNNQVADNLIGVSGSLEALPNGQDGIYLGGSMTATVS